MPKKYLNASSGSFTLTPSSDGDSTWNGGDMACLFGLAYKKKWNLPPFINNIIYILSFCKMKAIVDLMLHCKSDQVIE